MTIFLKIGGNTLYPAKKLYIMCIALLIIRGCKDVSMEQSLRWLDVYECDVRVEVATGDGVSAPVTAASHVTLSRRCHEDVTPQHPPHSTVSLADNSEEAAIFNEHSSIYFQSRPISALQLFPANHSPSLHEEGRRGDS